MRIIVAESPAAIAWLGTVADDPGSRVTSSSLHRLEISRVALRTGLDSRAVDDYFGVIDLWTIDQDLIDRAMRIPHYLKTLDTLHVQTALDLHSALGGEPPVIVTHDAAMARVAVTLGLTVHDPVTDDPRRGPVALG